MFTPVHKFSPLLVPRLLLRFYYFTEVTVPTLLFTFLHSDGVLLLFYTLGMALREVVLSSSQLEALRKLEAWAQAEPRLAGEEKPDTRSSQDSLSLVHSLPELEVFMMQMDRETRAKDRDEEIQHLARLKAQSACYATLVSELEETASRLSMDAERCNTMKATSSKLIASLEEETRKLREEEALAQVLDAQLKPVREARGIVPLLEEQERRPSIIHAPDHPLVQALSTLDRSATTIASHSHWRDSAAHSAEINQIRLRALRLVASVLLRHIDGLAGVGVAEEAVLVKVMHSMFVSSALISQQCSCWPLKCFSNLCYATALIVAPSLKWANYDDLLTLF